MASAEAGGEADAARQHRIGGVLRIYRKRSTDKEVLKMHGMGVKCCYSVPRLKFLQFFRNDTEAKGFVNVQGSTLMFLFTTPGFATHARIWGSRHSKFGQGVKSGGRRVYSMCQHSFFNWAMKAVQMHKRLSLGW